MDFQENKNLKFILGFIAVLFLISVTVWFGVDVANNLKRGKDIGRSVDIMSTITVSGTGEIYAKPDLALVDFSVVTEKTTVAEAIKENTRKMNAVIDSVKKQGVEDKDLKTTGFYIYPRYEYRAAEGSEMSLYPSGKRVLAGYEITQSLEVKIRDMAKIGNIIQTAIDNGANQVGDLQFTMDKQDELKAQARKEAIEKAKAKAREMASQLGVKLVRIVNFNEAGGAAIMYGLPEGIGGGGETEAPKIETGANKTEVTVSITYEID